MPTKRKEESQEQPRTDASGRELFPWEVDPKDQATRRTTSGAEKDDSVPAGAAQEDAVDQ